MVVASFRVDYLVLGGTVVDGLGGEPVVADVAIARGRVVGVGPALSTAYTVADPSTDLIDASGLLVLPGLIDTHAHDDSVLLHPHPPAPRAAAAPVPSPAADDGGIDAHHPLLPKVAQGVTTVIIGNCGISLAPLNAAASCTCGAADGEVYSCTCSPLPSPMYILGPRARYSFDSMDAYIAALDAAELPVNVGVLVGHASLRARAMGEDALVTRPANADEMAAMQSSLAEMGAAGQVLGLSTGLYYAIGAPAPTEEVVALAATLANASNGAAVYTTHLRDETSGVETALDEAIAIADAAGAHLVVSHVKAAGSDNWGKGPALVEKLTNAAAAAQAAGRNVAFDVYPYTASSTHLSAPHIRRSSSSLLAWSAVAPHLAGAEILDAAAQLGPEGAPPPTPEQAVAALEPGGGIYFQIDDGDLETLLACPLAMVGSDGLPLDSRPHPRLYGTFTRVLAKYAAADDGLLPLAEAVRRMTSLPAQTFGLVDRGSLTVGAFADLVVVDRTALTERATYEEPRATPAGVHYVFVNGEPVVRAGGAPPARILAHPGMVLKRPAAVHVARMKEALRVAAEAPLVSETPVGAAWFDDRTGALVATGHNRTVASRNATLHAELVALGELEAELGSAEALAALAPHLHLYVTLEPCGMCFSALRELGVGAIHYGAANPRFGGGTVLNLNAEAAAIPCVGGVCRDDAVELLKSFYATQNPATAGIHETTQA
ncbi:N-acyl-D-amino-acid deacylase [Thecamonas trahens ATCC 50062]|uniref:N-acyl-D-amino-acid deacylase n=1 Tax=Thecamonas trahens ATCC 50062 TaxID=461836 RepID=A0A0L0DFZ0_THETB|nr:N-acyl-D-amino-acid deacylase [Thecamonas trahens ATCC 50062]KNC51262.1 N-acyl-D-amino-acid deacylase [Thecamonas trahens ATCC 50062]|eukprot:XP_013756192.1 N-acyl-D-amino-acid deacylase [Thecamonas trahens ATCC 50062]